MLAVAAVLALAVGAMAVPAAAHATAPPSTDAVLLPQGSRFICEMHDEGSSSSAWVYCWEYLEGGSVGAHVRLDPEGEVSLTATERRPSGIGGPGEPFGAWATVGRFRCEVLVQGVECVLVATGKGFLAQADGIVEVQSEPGLTEPPPLLGSSATVQAVSGYALIEEPGSRYTRPLNTGARVPVGTEIDTRHGAVALRSAGAAGEVQTGVFRGGLFRFTQPLQGDPEDLTVLTLAGEAPMGCGGPGAQAAVALHRGGAGLQRLQGDAQGHFEIAGHYASATVEDAEWLVEDRCSETAVKVTRGIASVDDFPGQRTVSIAAGQSYLAHPGNGPSHALVWRALNGKVLCGVVSHGRSIPAVAMLCASRTIPPPRHTSHEEGDPGFVFLNATGAAHPTRVSQYPFQAEEGWLPKNQAVLRPGQTWSSGHLGVTCTIAAARIRCANRSGHGFTITKRSYRGF